jgi:hypothetical protein
VKVKNQNYINEKIKRWLNSVNDCYYSGQYVLLPICWLHIKHINTQSVSLYMFCSSYYTTWCITVQQIEFALLCFGYDIAIAFLRTGCWGEYWDLKGRKWQEGEICVIRSFIICILQPLLLCWSDLGGWGGETCTCMGEMRNTYKILIRKSGDMETIWKT